MASLACQEFLLAGDQQGATCSLHPVQRNGAAFNRVLAGALNDRVGTLAFRAQDHMADTGCRSTVQVRKAEAVEHCATVICCVAFADNRFHRRALGSWTISVFLLSSRTSGGELQSEIPECTTLIQIAQLAPQIRLRSKSADQNISRSRLAASAAKSGSWCRHSIRLISFRKSMMQFR